MHLKLWGASMFPKHVVVQITEICEMFEAQNKVAWDDVHGVEPPMAQVLEARHEEMNHMKYQIFEVVKRKECFEKTGKPPISTRWVDTDKSHGQGEMKVRSRWVARDFKTRGERDREDLFCATPPLELLRWLVYLMIQHPLKMEVECAK